MTGARALLEMLRAAGVEHLFGNPGTTELPVIDELADFRGITYHLALQEAVAVGMADGYAQASGRVGVLSLHATAGVANALGLLFNAGRAGSPLLALSGQQDSRLLLQEPFLYSDMVRWVRPLVKWAYQIAHPGDMGRALRRALSEAVSPPTGPVFLALPLDVLRAAGSRCEDVSPRLSLPAAPDAEGLDAAAGMLRSARAPLIVAGDRVAQAGAEAALLSLAEAAGWPVALEPFPTRFLFPHPHPLWRGALPRFAGAVRERLSAHDVVLVAGLTPFEHFLYDGVDPLPPDTRLVHLDTAPAFIGRNHPVAAGVVGDLREAFAALRARLCSESRDRGNAALQASQPDGESRPAPPGDAYERVADAVAGVLGAEDILVEEAISGRDAVLARIPRRHPGTFFGEKGGTIGWGLPAALGVKVARPERRVLAVVGDGSLLMTAQALWTAGRERLPVGVVVLDNAGYGILKQGLATLGGESARRGVYPATDVQGADLLGIARAFGVSGERVALSAGSGGQAGDAVGAAVRRALEAGAPYVVDVDLDVPVRPLI
jgi:benzoylformate decarboxylase